MGAWIKLSQMGDEVRSHPIYVSLQLLPWTRQIRGRVTKLFWILRVSKHACKLLKSRDKFLDSSLAYGPSSALPQLVIPNVLLVSALGLAKEILVFSHWDIAWITFCILGIASIAVCVGAFASGHWKRKNIEVLRTSHSLECLLTRCIVACSRIRVLFTVYPPHFSVRRIIQHVLISVSPSLHDEMPAIDRKPSGSLSSHICPPYG